MIPTPGERCQDHGSWAKSRSLSIRYWHKADIDLTLNMSAFGGKADIPDPLSMSANDP